MNAALYDRIGTGYAATRQADPRVAEPIIEAIGVATTVVNVGAGSGSYEPADKRVVAVAPSATMISQRPRGSAPAVQAPAEMLPFERDCFDCALAILPVHHWVDALAGLRELRRVARKRVVVLTCDQNLWERFWLVAEYLQALALFDRRQAIPLELIISALGSCEVRPGAVRYDCLDGFLGVDRRRPSAYLDANIRAVMSGFA
jgi:SAM-dependent methyltransferase